MTKSIDLRSFLIGGLAVLLILCAVGAAPWLGQDRFERFTIGATADGAFILDTATGQAWAYETSRGVVSSYVGAQAFFAPKTPGLAPAGDPNASIR